MKNNLPRRERDKARHEAEIIRSAEKVFSKKGFENTTMDEIAEESEFTKRTIYKYFLNKEDLFFAIVLSGFQKLFSYIEASIKNGKNGFDKIHSALLAYYKFYKDSPEIFHLMNYVGYIKSKKNSGTNHKKFFEFDDFLFKKLIKIIEEGKIDGSIRNDLEAGSLAYSIVFTATGFFHQLLISGKTFTNHFSIDLETFSKFTIELLSSAFKNNKN